MIEKIKYVLGEVKEEPALAASLTEETRIIDDLALDSLQLMIFLMKLEDEFAVELDYENFDMNHLADISTLAAFLNERKETAGVSSW